MNWTTRNPLSKGTDPTASAGVDLKYALKPGLTLTGTINPQHMTEDLQSDRFTITSDDLQRLETIGL